MTIRRPGLQKRPGFLVYGLHWTQGDHSVVLPYPNSTIRLVGMLFLAEPAHLYAAEVKGACAARVGVFGFFG
jgi:hypothetical protein